MNTTVSYKQVLLKSVQVEKSKELIKSVVKTINNSMSRKTTKDDEWPIWVFCEKGYQMQSTNCILCGNYIKIGWNCKNVDPERKINHIYCNDLKHQHATNTLVKLIWVKDLLKLYYTEKQNRFLYYAALECILHLKPELHTFARAFREYIGIPHNVC
jgi:hypothetical protein